MENCGTLYIHISEDSEFNKYDFGISLANRTSPYFWGGESVIDEGRKAQKFEGLQAGEYSWFVKLKTGGGFVGQGISQVNCDSIVNSEELDIYKMSTAKGVELAGVIQNEVYQAMLRLAKKQNDYAFYSELQIDETFTGGLFLRTTKNVLKIFSDLGVLLKGKYLEDINNFGNLDYIIISEDGINSIIFNPQIFSTISEFQFFCKENKFKDYLLEDFLRSDEFGGVGNDYDSTLNILPDFILSLQD